MDVDSETSKFAGMSFDQILSSIDPLPSFSPTSHPEAPVMAQVLGFKFTFYHNSDTPNHAPRNLYLTAAILIREGFITLEDLYAHLSPSDEQMEEVHKKYISNIGLRSRGNKLNLLALAAPLEGASYGSKEKVTHTEPSKPTAKEREQDNQKIGLLSALLSIGAIKQGLAMLSKFPWIVDARPEIADLLLRIMRLSMEPIYRSYVVKDKELPINGFTQPKTRYASHGLPVPPTKRHVLTTMAPTPPGTATSDFVFFFPNWMERVPVCRTIEDLRNVIEPLMHFVGVHLSRNVMFIQMYVRLARFELSTIEKEAEDEEGEKVLHPIWAYWYRILRAYLLPALPLVRGNAVCTVEMWGLIRLFDVAARWSLYSEWQQTYKAHPELQVCHAEATREAKDILRRLSHQTIDSLSGPVAKLIHTNPCIFFPRAVQQVMAYDNMAAVVVQSLRYCASMDFDVLVFCILDALSTPGKERVKDDGVNTSDWLQSLSSFIGMLFKRYSTDISPMLNYIVHQLYQDATSEIIVLRELIYNMAGIEPLPSLNESQIQAMAGGPTLRTEAVASATRGARFDPAEFSNRPAHRLGRALMDTQLALPLLIQVAQQRESCVFKVSEAPLKPLASLFDTTHGVLLQYLELLTAQSIISMDEYATHILPSLGDLAVVYGISAPICMQIIRPVLQSSILRQLDREEARCRLEEEQRLKAQLMAKRDAANSSAMDVEVTTSPWIPELEVLFDDIAKILPSNAYNVIGPGFYTTFWQMSTYDLSPPVNRYEEEIKALKALSQAEDQKYISADRSSDRRRRQTASAHRLRRDRFNAFAKALVDESALQVGNRGLIIKRLAREKNHWFAQSNSHTSELIDAIIEHCIQPRCLLSPMDADYCVQMIKTIHIQGTPNFHTLGCYDKLLDAKVGVVLSSCTEYEAKNYGRFLLGILSDLDKWRTDEQIYLQDNKSKNAQGQRVVHTGFGSTAHSLAIPWRSLQGWIRKTHDKLTQTFIRCIRTGKFMHVYNTIITLKEILPVYPLSAVHPMMGTAIYEELKAFLEKEERGDLKIIAKAYFAGLEKLKPQWDRKVPTAPAKPAPPTQPRATAKQTPPVDPKVRAVPPPGPGTPSGPAAQRQPPPQPQQPSTAPSNAPSAPRADVAKPTGGFSASIPKPQRISRPKEPPQASSPRTGTPVLQPPQEAAPVPQEVKRSEVDSKSAATVPTSDPNAMQPPSVPSQTPAATELRDARHSRADRDDDKPSRSQPGSRATSPRRRSPSPSRPGTRNPSSDSRTSGGRRSDRKEDERRTGETRSSGDREPPIRRDSLTHDRRDRRNKEEREDDRSRIKRDRERHERDHRFDRERERDRESGRDKDRHRRDEKDRKEREPSNREVPNRANSDGDSARRAGDDVSSHKRRRETEEDASRPPKRGSNRREPADVPSRDRHRKRHHAEGDDFEKGERRSAEAPSRGPPTGPRKGAEDGASPPTRPANFREARPSRDTYTPTNGSAGPDMSATRSLQSRIGGVTEPNRHEDDRDGRKRPHPDREVIEGAKRIRLDRRGPERHDAAARAQNALDSSQSRRGSGRGR